MNCRRQAGHYFRLRSLAPLLTLAAFGIILLAASLNASALISRSSSVAQPPALPFTRSTPPSVNAPAPSAPLALGSIRPRMEAPRNKTTRNGFTTSPPGPFPFQTVNSGDGLITLHYYYRSASDAAELANSMSGIVNDTVKARLGLTLQHQVDVYAYNSRADFLSGAVPNAPSVTAAYTIYSGSAIYLPIYSGIDWVSVISHELTHAVLHQNYTTGQLTYYLYPNWLDEGLAESDVPTGGLYATFDDQILASAVVRGSLVDIFSIFRWQYPQDVATDDLCYAESRAFIRYAVEIYGQTRFQGFVHDLLDGNYDYAADANFGIDMQMLQANWLRSMGVAAPAHPAATLPTPAVAQPFTSSHLGGVATTTTPFAVAGANNLLIAALVKLGVLLGILLLVAALVELGVRLLWPRLPLPQRISRVAASPPGLTSAFAQASGPVDSSESSASTLADAAGSRVAVAAAPAGAKPASSWRVLPARAWELAAIGLALPVAFGIGALASQIDPTRLWRHAYLAAVLVLLVGIALVVALGVRDMRSRQVVVPVYAVALVVLLVSAVTTFGDGGAAGVAQGRAYDDAQAYALADAAMQDANAPRADRYQAEWLWAQAADGTDDPADASVHYRDALALAPTAADAQSVRYRLMLVTNIWGAQLTRAHQFDEALAVYTGELSTTSCDTACHTTLANESGATYLAWADFLIASKQVDTATAKLRDLVAQFPATKAAASAKAVLDAEGKGLAPAVAAKQSGDITAMNLVLERLAVEKPDAPDAALASGFSEPVSATIIMNQLYGPSRHVMLFAFGDLTSAQAFTYDRINDTSLFKVATQANVSGNFSVYAPAGYFYVPVWEAPSQDGRPGWHYVSISVFTVAPFSPLSVPTVIEA